MVERMTIDLAAVEATRERLRSEHLRPAGERPASTARGLHHTALVSGDPEGVHRVGTPDHALALAQSLAADMGASEIALIGGAIVFAAFAARTDRLHLTIIDLSPAADTFFATPDPYLWRETARRVPDRRADDDAPCLFLEYERA